MTAITAIATIKFRICIDLAPELNLENPSSDWVHPRLGTTDSIETRGFTGFR
jgi:hypothetical protein